MAARFPAAAQWEGYDTLTARLLREHPGTDIVSLGPLTAFAALFDRDFGGYGGAALLKEYAGTLYVMAGRFDSPEPEWNVAQDVAAARRFVKEAANDIVFLPFETGVGIFTGRPFKTDKDNPCRACFTEFFGGEPDPFVRSSWDPLTAYVAAFGTDGFDVSPPGTVTVSETGVTAFAPGADGKHRYISRCKDGGLAEARVDALLLP